MLSVQVAPLRCSHPILGRTPGARDQGMIGFLSPGHCPDEQSVLWVGLCVESPRQGFGSTVEEGVVSAVPVPG